MRNKGFLRLALILLAASCGGGREKAAFDRYEKAVDPVLEEEAELRARFDEQVKDLQILDQREGFEELIRNRMVPFYDRMLERVAEVRPEGEALRGIHLLLRRYVELRREMFETYRALERLAKEVEEREGPASEAVDRATEAVQAKADLLNPLLAENEALVGHLRDLLARDRLVGLQFMENLALLRQGAVRAAAFRKFAEEQAGPFYDAALEELDGIDDLAEGVVEGVKAARAYFRARTDLVAASLELADARGAAEADLVGLQDRFAGTQQEAEEALETYKRAAKEYRDALR